MEEKLYTVGEIAKLFSVDRETVRRWLQTDRLHGRKTGLQWFVTKSEVTRFGFERGYEWCKTEE